MAAGGYARRRPGTALLLTAVVNDSLSRAVGRARTHRRLTILLLVHFLVVALVVWRLVALQVIDAEQFQALASRQTQREIALPASRGSITDRSGQPLAMSLSAATVFANPRVIAESGIDPFMLGVELAPVLERPLDELLELLQADREFVYLGRQLPRAVGEEVLALDLPGVGVLEEPTRTYPAGQIASQVVGWAGVDNTGLAGLELAYDEELGGIPGTLRLEEAPGGLAITAAPREVVPATPGVDLQLTIDREIQYTTERILAEAVATYDALGGSAVVLHAGTGEILAMASVPSVDPEEYGQATEFARRNRAVTDVFEPGSVNKVITIAGALEDGLVTPDQGFSVPWRLAIGPEMFHDASPHAEAWWTTHEIMARSSNIGTIRIAQLLGEERLDDYVRAFGIGRETGLGFPGESRGLLADVEDWTISSLPTIAIGQGVSATLLQVANVFGVIANDGEWVAPQLVRGTVDADGTFTAAAPAERQRVVSVETAREVAAMLVDVVEEDYGTGNLAAVPGYQVGGKTGTAQKPLEGERGYAEDAFIASFAGFAPADDPQLVVAVMLDEPTPHYGGLTAAPTFAEIMEFALRNHRVAPAEPSAPLPAGHRIGNTIAVRPPGDDPTEEPGR